MTFFSSFLHAVCCHRSSSSVFGIPLSRFLMRPPIKSTSNPACLSYFSPPPHSRLRPPPHGHAQKIGGEGVFSRYFFGGGVRSAEKEEARLGLCALLPSEGGERMRRRMGGNFFFAPPSSPLFCLSESGEKRKKARRKARKETLKHFSLNELPPFFVTIFESHPQRGNVGRSIPDPRKEKEEKGKGDNGTKKHGGE